jgi:DNA polymerase-3 subunit delta'
MIDVPDPLQSLAVIGHDEAKREVDAAFAQKRMHHAWLITGPQGIGKMTLAVHIAHILLSGGENGFARFNPEHPSARLLRAGSHPDLFVLRCPADEKTGFLKDTIPVDEARKIAPFLRMTASHGASRVAIVDEAHKLNRNGQNALLKIIEEPSKGATIIMTATTSASLLPTIRSRCRTLALSPLPAQNLEVVLMRLGAEIPADKARFLELAGGSAGTALELLRSDGLVLFEVLMGLLGDLPALDVPALHRIADSLGKKADAGSFEIVTSLLIRTLREAAKATALGQSDPSGLSLKLGGRAQLDKLLDLWENISRRFAAARDSNLDKKPVFIEAITEIKRCAEKA